MYLREAELIVDRCEEDLHCEIDVYFYFEGNEIKEKVASQEDVNFLRENLLITMTSGSLDEEAGFSSETYVLTEKWFEELSSYLEKQE